MSNTRAEPCTCVAGLLRGGMYIPPLKHLSFALAPTRGMIGRVGPTICGQRSGVDQERAQYLVSSRFKWRSIKIHELQPCERCHNFVRRLPA